jgi:hypothetical protein
VVLDLTFALRTRCDTESNVRSTTLAHLPAKWNPVCRFRTRAPSTRDAAKAPAAGRRVIFDLLTVGTGGGNSARARSKGLCRDSFRGSAFRSRECRGESSRATNFRFPSCLRLEISKRSHRCPTRTRIQASKISNLAKSPASSRVVARNPDSNARIRADKASRRARTKAIASFG